MVRGPVSDLSEDISKIHRSLEELQIVRGLSMCLVSGRFTLVGQRIGTMLV